MDYIDTTNVKVLHTHNLNINIKIPNHIIDNKPLQLLTISLSAYLIISATSSLVNSLRITKQ